MEPDLHMHSFPAVHNRHCLRLHYSLHSHPYSDPHYNRHMHFHLDLRCNRHMHSHLDLRCNWHIPHYSELPDNRLDFLEIPDSYYFRPFVFPFIINMLQKSAFCLYLS
jgi:hypothetical protein